MDRTLLASASSVAVSTTLATTAIVEGRGQKTGLLVMPPYGWRDLTGFNHAPVAAIKGQLEITGEVREAVDPEEVLHARPHSVAEATLAMGKLHHTLLPWRRLAGNHRLPPYALTPTDVLHAAGTITLWDAPSGTKACGWHATMAGMSTEAFVTVC